MTRLTQYDDSAPFAERARHSDFDAMVAALASIGVGLERWRADVPLSAASRDEDILAAYAGDIERLKARGGYQSCDVLRVTPDRDDLPALRQKFLAEHVHDDDEVRFFVEGAALFYIRAGGVVHALECTAGDLIVLPAGMTHWFDTGERPDFTVIRLFVTPEGWVARYTGDKIAESIPLYEPAL